MVLSDTSKGDIGWKKWVVAGWAFMECLLFGGLLYGWGSLVFVFKEEAIYANLCPHKEISFNSSGLPDSFDYQDSKSNSSVLVVMLTPSSNVSSNNNSSQITEDVTVKKSGGDKSERCVPQDEQMALCFTIASAIFCAGCAVMGHINYKFGTRVSRIIAL